MKLICESVVEEFVIDKLLDLDYEHINETNDNWVTERKLDSFINEELLLSSMMKINKGISIDLLETAIAEIKNIDRPSLFERNKLFHMYLTDGITIEDPKAKANPQIRFIDFNNEDNNIFQVANQIKFKEYHNTRIPDVLIYVNGIPIIIFELKSVEYRKDTFIEQAYEQLGRNGERDGYRYDIPTLFNYNCFQIISDGANSKIGTITSDLSRYSEWKSIEGEIGYKKNFSKKLDVLLNGVFRKDRLLDIIENNLFFIEKNKQKPIKILTQYHQYFGVLKSRESIKKHIKPNGDGKAGILWHTQGSGKSFSMLMLAKRLISDISLSKPTIVILTDRNDLDNQLFLTFADAKHYLRTTPIKVASRKQLVQELEKIKEGGIIFSTIQKFDKDNTFTNSRNNIIVFSDEAHRSHYGVDEKLKVVKNTKGDIESVESIFGMEKYIRDSLPNATFIGFTGTPVDTRDKSTAAIFGEIVDTYDMTQSIEDGSTVKLYYESRLAKVWLDNDKLKEIDRYYEECAELGATDEQVSASKSKLTNMEIIVGDEDRLKLLANDIYKHYTERKNFLNGKAMIVCMSRKIAFKLYKQLVDIDKSLENDIALVVSESNKDTEEEKKLFGSKAHKDELAKQFKSTGVGNGKASKKIAIVVDMWLTGFDVPDLDVMYIDKPMQGHNLMQAIARVNRIFPGKESGLIVDYIGIKKHLDSALDKYTARDKDLNLKDIQETAKTLIDENLSILNEMFYKTYNDLFVVGSATERFEALQEGVQFVLDDGNRKKEFLRIVKSLKNAFVVAGGILNKKYKDRILYYVTIRHYIQKLEYEGGNSIDTASMNKKVEELIAEAIKGDEVKVLSVINEDKEKVKIWDLLREDKIEALRKSNPPHIFIKIMEKLLKEAVMEYKKYNLVKSNEYSEKLRMLLERYNTREDARDINKTINDLVVFSREMVEDENSASSNSLQGRERAFYDALIKESSAEQMMKDGILFQIAKELKTIVEEYSTVDWSKKQSTRAKMRLEIKKLLKKYNYPPEYQEGAVERVISQAEYLM